MLINGAETHPNVEAVAAEEAEWQAISFREGDNPAILEVGRTAALAYYARMLEGTSSPGYIEHLPEVPHREVTQEQALRLRGEYDANWRLRPELAANLHDLWVADFFGHDNRSPLLIGYTDSPSEGHPDRGYTVRVEPDGAVGLHVEDPSYTDGGKGGVVWHEYRLPRGVFFAEHEVQRIDGAHYQRQIVASDVVISEVNFRLELIANFIGRSERSA
jgi:hypothetical protein